MSYARLTHRVVSACCFGFILIFLPGIAMPQSSLSSTSPEKTAAVSAPSKTAIPVGAFRMQGSHLVRPREEVVESQLRREGKIRASFSPQQEKMAIAEYQESFAKQSASWVSPEVRQRALDREAAIVAKSRLRTSASAAIQPVSIKVFTLAVDFGATETVTGYVTTTQTATLMMGGPRKGGIPRPGPLDNQTVWYESSQIANPSFYEKLIFGYEGVGRIRTDLTDPDDGKPGINLAGYTVQDYYDHVAGKGNVQLSGVVKGWVTVNHCEGYYGADGPNNNHGGGNGVPVAQLVSDAVTKFNQDNPGFDWRPYDANHDNIVDTFWLVHAGMGQESGGGKEGRFSIWSHSSDLRNYGQWSKGFKVFEGDSLTTADNVYIGPYTMQPENLDLGVLCEEFGHNVFGFPDLYTTDHENSVGFWSNMSAGSWGGWLGGSVPVGMPLWFRMIAQTQAGFCNWQQGMVVRDYDDPAANIAVGQLEDTPTSTAKGVRINLPDIEEVIPNKIDTTLGKAASTGKGRNNIDITLSKTVLLPNWNLPMLAFRFWCDIEKGWDYGYVVANGEILKDMDGYTTNSNPSGNNLGYGLTGSYSGILRFDLSKYKGTTVTLQFRYKTDTAVTGLGWWIDEVSITGFQDIKFEDAGIPGTFPGWINSSPGWLVTPYTATYPNYYLLEWRAPTKYDRMLRTAYITSYNDDLTNEWQVQRTPYNIPGALLYYRNSQYTDTYSIWNKSIYYSWPSIGPKYQLLVVEMNYQRMKLEDIQYWFNPRVSSYDATLSFQSSPAFTITRLNTSEGPKTGSWQFPEKAAVTRFDDSKAYYAGYWTSDPSDNWFYWNNFSGSAVIPARDWYTVRITKPDGLTPHPALYGGYFNDTPNSRFGTGNPGDSGVQYGVVIELKSPLPNDTGAVINFKNSVVTRTMEPWALYQ